MIRRQWGEDGMYKSAHGEWVLYIEAQDKIDALKAQNGQLQAALQAVIDSADYVDTGHQIAIDALAKLKGVLV